MESGTPPDREDPSVSDGDLGQPVGDDVVGRRDGAGGDGGEAEADGEVIWGEVVFLKGARRIGRLVRVEDG